MDFFTRKIRFLWEKPKKSREITKIDAYFELGYRILSWEDVSLTLSVFLALNFFFWLAIQLQLRLFGAVFLLALVAFLGDSCFDIGGAPHLEALDELKADLTDVVLSLKALRKDSPSSFCIGMSFVFLVISFIAKNISGYVIVYLVLLGVFFVPLGLSKLPPEYVSAVKQFVKNVGSERGVLAEDELIPFISDKDFSRRDPDLDSLLTDRTADSVTNSLVSGLASMPSYLDGEDKESLAEEDLLPGGRTPGDISSDSDSEHRGIRFESRHFNGDSSEEEHFSKNLSFDRKDSSSDSDFEIINTEEAEEQ